MISTVAAVFLAVLGATIGAAAICFALITRPARKQQ